MLRKSHIITSQAITTGLLMANQTSLPFILTSFCGVWLGAQLPDVDSKNTKINHRLGFVGKLLGHITHRTWTHTIWAVIILLAFAIWCPVALKFNVKPHDPPLAFLSFTITDNYLKSFLYFTVWGYFMHLFEDNFSRQGVCFLYPFSHFRKSRRGYPYKKRPFRSYYYKTGGDEEKYIRRFMLVVFIAEIIELFMQNYLVG